MTALLHAPVLPVSHEVRMTIRAGEEDVHGVVRRTRISGDGIRLGADFAASIPILPIGQEVDTRLGSRETSGDLELAGRVILQARTGSGVHCLVAYPTSGAPLLRNLVSPRNAVRVAPSPSLPLAVRLPDDVDVQVQDVSTSGVALLLEEEAPDRLSTWTIDLLVSFPDHEQELEFRGNVRVRKLSGTAVLYGIEFDERRTKDFCRKQELVQRYVMQRQTEMLAERRERRRAA